MGRPLRYVAAALVAVFIAVVADVRNWSPAAMQQLTLGATWATLLIIAAIATDRREPPS